MGRPRGRAPGSSACTGQRPWHRPRALRRHAKERHQRRGGRVHMVVNHPLELASHGPVIPVIVIDSVDDAVPLARALVEGGVRVLEVTLRTPAALACIEAMARAVPEALVGAGTVRTAADARAARDAGCAFAVSPGYTAAVAQACREAGLPLLPGVATASE